MKVIGAALVVLFILTATSAMASPWLDQVVEFNQPSGSSTNHNDPTNALGPENANFVSIDIPETLILAFTDNFALEGPGNDLRIIERGGDSADANIFGSENGTDWTFLMRARSRNDIDNFYIDLAGTGLNYVSFLRFDGLDNDGSSPGFDLDAVEALNSQPVPIPGALILLGSGVLGLLGIKRRAKA